MEIVIKEVEERKEERRLARLFRITQTEKEPKFHETRTKILELRSTKSQTEIAEILGITPQAVSYMEIQLGLSRQGHRRPAEVIEVGCAACGKTLNVKWYLIKRRKNFFCGRECRKLLQFQALSVLLDKRQYFCSLCKKTFSNPLARMSGKYSFCCRKCNTDRLREYRKTPSGKVATLKAAQKNNLKSPEKLRARTLLNQAVKIGKVVRPEVCFTCHKNKKLDAHHPDYSKPLKVKWYCRVCHLTVHGRIKAKELGE